MPLQRRFSSEVTPGLLIYLSGTLLVPSFLGLVTALEAEGWEVHDQPEDPDHYETSPIETIGGSPEEREAEVTSRLQAIGSDPHAPGHQRALILFCSHTGGHKFAGNIIVRDLTRQLSDQ